MISLQTNVDALDAINNLNTDNVAQGKTIQQLSSGYRINSSGDDAAGLAVANGYQNEVTQLTQGVSNANDGIAQLQIIDGGLSNISNILNRLQTLASESASGTFTGSRVTLNQEYQNLLGEITRQATNIGLNSGGTFNTNLNVFIGGSNSSSSASVNVDLSGTSSAVDAGSLGLQGTDVLGGTVGGVDFGAGTGGRLDDPGSTFLDSNGTQSYTFNYTDSSGNAQSRSVTVTGSSSGVSGTDVISQLNSGLAGTGITASIDSSSGDVQFSSSGAFTAGVGAATAGHSTATGGPIVNTAQYNVTSATFSGTGTTLSAADTFTLSNGTDSANISLASGATVAGAVTTINAALRAANITNVTAIATGNAGAISFQSTSNFSIVDTTAAAASSSPLFSALTSGNATVAAPTGGTSSSTDAQNAINAIAAAIQNLGLVQGRVGAGENQLNYAVGLAQSQITNVSTAEGEIKDTDMATQASNLSKDQVLEQTAVAALAQANSMPQAVLKLLQ